MSLQSCSLPRALQAEFDAIPTVQQRVAFKIAIGPTLEARSRVWAEVPQRWRDDVRRAVALTMGAMIGSLQPWALIGKALDDVPPELRADVRNQALRVYQLGITRKAR